MNYEVSIVRIWGENSLKWHCTVLVRIFCLWRTLIHHAVENDAVAHTQLNDWYFISNKGTFIWVVYTVIYKVLFVSKHICTTQWPPWNISNVKFTNKKISIIQCQKPIYIDDLVQECCISIVLKMEMPQSCIKPSIYNTYIINQA